MQAHNIKLEKSHWELQLCNLKVFKSKTHMKRIMNLQSHKIHNLGILELSLRRPKHLNISMLASQ